MNTVAKLMLFIGAVGILVLIALNIYAAMVSARSSSILFSQLWWGQWFPLYLVMSSVAFVGLVSQITMKKKGVRDNL
jgi:hypothetical protein